MDNSPEHHNPPLWEPDRLRLFEEREAKVEALRNALIEGEQSGRATPFDFDVFIARKRST